MGKHFFRILAAHKVMTTIVALAMIGGGYYFYTKQTTTSPASKYVTAAVERGTLTVSVSGAGQVSSSNQIDIKPVTSGKITKVFIPEGQDVAEDALLVQLDTASALKAARDAEASLRSAILSLQKLQTPADALSIMQSKNAVTQAEVSLSKMKALQADDYQAALDAKKKATDSLTKSYDDGFNEISNSFLDLPAIITALDSTLHGNDITQADKSLSSGSTNAANLTNTIHNADDQVALQPYLTTAESDYQAARTAYDANLTTYNSVGRFSDRPVIESILSRTISTVRLMAESAKSETTLLDDWIDLRAKRNATDYPLAVAKVNQLRSSLNTYNGQVNGHLSSLLSVQQTLQNGKDSLTSAERSIVQMDRNNPLDIAASQQSLQEKKISADKLEAGALPIDIQASQLNVQQRQNALDDVRSTLADYLVRAPIAGTVAKLAVKLGDQASSGTVIATLVAKQQVADVTLNEVDVAKVQVGQKATMTFDAIDGFTMTGEVAGINTLGTVLQGVVSYAVKIGFDAQDSRIKPGMSVSAAIIIDVKQDVLLVPNSAVKSQGQISYVEELVSGLPVRHTVQVGESNDTATAVTGDIKEGDQVVTQTITATTTTTAPTGGGFGGIRIPGVTGGGGRPGG